MRELLIVAAIAAMTYLVVLLVIAPLVYFWERVRLKADDTKHPHLAVFRHSHRLQGSLLGAAGLLGVAALGIAAVIAGASTSNWSGSLVAALLRTVEFLDIRRMF